MRPHSSPHLQRLAAGLHHPYTPILVLLALWGVLVLPSAIFNQWFTLDIGYLLSEGRKFPGNLLKVLSPYDGSGRYFPVYFLMNFLQARLFGANVPAYYLVQSGMFLLASSATCYLFYKITRSLPFTTLLVVLVYLSTPNTENLYTIGKPEPIAYLFVIFTLLLSYRAMLAPQRAWISYVSIVLLFCLAVLTKETSVVVFGLLPTAIVVGYLGRKLGLLHQGGLYYLRMHRFLLPVLLAGLALARLPYLLFDNVTTNTHSYTDYEITPLLVWENFYFYLTQQPDIAFCGVAALVCVLYLAKKLYGREAALSLRDEGDLTFMIGVLAVGWAYYGGLLFWRWPMAYYLYLPSLLFRLVAVYGFYLIMREGLFTRRQWRISTGLIGITLAYGLVYWFYVATAQIHYSRMYTEAMQTYMNLAKDHKEHRLVIESYPFYSEQRTNTSLAMDVISGEEYTVDGIADLVDPAVNTPEMMSLLHITPEDIEANEANIPRKDDYLMVMTGDKLAHWFIRGVTPYNASDSLLHKEHSYDMELVAENKLNAPTIFANVWTSKINSRKTYLGYKIYRITGERPRFFWRHHFPDGWMGRFASLRVWPEYGDAVRVTVSTPDFLPKNHLTVRQEGKVVKELDMVSGQEYVFDLPRNKAHTPNHFTFDVTNAVVPKKIKINKDRREIGMLLRIDPVPAPPEKK